MGTLYGTFSAFWVLHYSVTSILTLCLVISLQLDPWQRQLMPSRHLPLCRTSTTLCNTCSQPHRKHPSSLHKNRQRAVSYIENWRKICTISLQTCLLVTVGCFLTLRMKRIQTSVPLSVGLNHCSAEEEWNKKSAWIDLYLPLNLRLMIKCIIWNTQNGKMTLRSIISKQTGEMNSSEGENRTS